ncbi:T9SS type A sorting domain-containing protein [Lutibacter agarilyticus]|nr:T9SS type A sorting domain-containing protein [Lutibacter agarilyticus]
MKKITLLLLLLTATLGYAQTSNYCSTEVFHLDIPAETVSAINLTIVNTGATTMKVTAAHADITFLDLLGSITGAPNKSAADTSVPGEISITLTWTGTPPTDVTIQHIQWSKTTGGIWQKNDATTPFAGVCAPPPAPEEDASLSDLLVDGNTISTFSPITLDYNVFLPSETTIAPTITATTTHGLATTVITQATGLPGSATVVVTSEDTLNEKIYTVSFILAGPNVGAPTPTQAQTEVISVFSQITNDFADPNPTITSHYADIANTNYNPNWGGGSGNVVIESLAGDVVLKYPNLNYQGTALGSHTDVGTMEYLHIDFWTDAGTSLRISIISVTTGEVAYDIDAALGTLPQGQWVGIDVPLSYLTDVNANFDFNIKELKFDEGIGQTFYFDNLYFWKTPVDSATDTTLSDLTVDGSTLTGFNASTLTYDVILPKGTTVVPTVVGTTTQGSPATAVTSNAGSLPGSSTILVTAQDGSTTETYTVNFTVDTNTACAGNSSEAEQGTFSNGGYSYAFETLENGDVRMTFELLEAGATSVVAYAWRAAPNFSETPMTVTGNTATLDLNGFTTGEVINYAVKFVWADGGFGVTKYFTYTVGDDCGTLSIKDFEIEGLIAYPNPTKGKWLISTKDQEIQAVDVFNVLGKKVLSLKPNTLSVNVDASSLAPGVYITTITTEKGTSSRKLIKN